MFVLSYRVTICFMLLWGLMGCQSFGKKQLTSMPVQYPQKERLEFTGRGAAAAMMMSGSMGAMGIAIGVAIDEGIAKDLHASASQGGFDAKAVVSEVLQQYALAAQHLDKKGGAEERSAEGRSTEEGSTGRGSAKSEFPSHLAIKHLGFRSAGDQITPWVEVDRIEGSSVKSMTYADVAGDQAVTAELNDLRGQSEQAAAMLTTALQQVLIALWE